LCSENSANISSPGKTVGVDLDGVFGRLAPCRLLSPHLLELLAPLLHFTPPVRLGLFVHGILGARCLEITHARGMASFLKLLAEALAPKVQKFR
jgi:hypothetical protein